jgi:hypothetical protein
MEKTDIVFPRPLFNRSHVVILNILLSDSFLETYFLIVGKIAAAYYVVFFQLEEHFTLKNIIFRG